MGTPRPMPSLAELAELAARELPGWPEEIPPPAAILEAYYRRLHPDRFALALHRLTGWPLVLIACSDGHRLGCLVRAEDGRLLGAGGWSHPKSIERYFGCPDLAISVPGGEELLAPDSAGRPDRAGYLPELAAAVYAIRQLPGAPFSRAWFRAMSHIPQAGIDWPLYADPDPAREQQLELDRP